MTESILDFSALSIGAPRITGELAVFPIIGTGDVTSNWLTLNEALAKGTRDAETAQIGFQRVGTVGGDHVLGVPLSELRAANQRFFDEWMES